MFHREEPRINWMPLDGSPRRRLQAAFSPMPLVAARYATPAFRAGVRAELERTPYDCVILDYYALGWALEELHTPNRPACVVYISQNFEIALAAETAQKFRGQWVQKIFLYLNAWKIARMERRLVHSVDLLTVITDDDRQAYLNEFLPRRPPLTLPPSYLGHRRAQRKIDASVPRRVVVLGAFQWIPKQINLEAFLEASDKRFALIGIELVIAGAVSNELCDRWRGRLRATTFSGYIDDLSSFFDQARMGLLIEAIGGGFKLKTLDYVFERLPVAALSVSLAGIDAGLRAHFLVRDRADLLVEAIASAIDDFEVLNGMQEGAFAAAHGYFDWETNGRHLLASMKDVIAQNDRTGCDP